ncbi:MAG TPA: hypothetical protein VH877_07525 [Polyangia bacterium]|jgi:hypothetical protein|nr:hypothetical protein [Polyangia bacterium]
MSGAGEWRRLPRVLVGIGCCVLLYGLVGLLRHAAVTTPVWTAVRWILILMTNDLVLMPLVIVVGVLTTRLPRAFGPVVRAGLIISGCVFIVATWGVIGQIREVQPGNNEILPNHYPTSLALILGPVWAVLLLVGLARSRRKAGKAAARPR